MFMNRYQLRGILISFVFIGFLFVFDVDLGRVFWIALVVLCAVAALYFIFWIAMKAFVRR